jgi:hypothetical protein
MIVMIKKCGTWLAVKQVGPAIGNAEGRVPIGARQELLGVWGNQAIAFVLVCT